MNDYQPDIVSDAGHGGLEKVSQLNVNKHLTNKIREMVLSGRIPPDSKHEVELIRDNNNLEEPCENPDTMDADALASAGYGTDEDYGDTSITL